MSSGSLTVCSSYKSAPKFSFSAAGLPKDRVIKNPGPGTYDVGPADRDKFAHSPNYSMCGAPGGGKEAEAQAPGPGAYSPLVTDSGKAWGMSSAPRLRELKKSKGPGPGQYDVMTRSDGFRGPAIAGRVSGPKIGMNPGPGNYNPVDTGLSTCRSWGAPKFAATGRSAVRASKTPGPGAYDMKTSLGGHFAMPSPPHYSVMGKRSEPKKEMSPGPGGATFSQFK